MKPTYLLPGICLFALGGCSLLQPAPAEDPVQTRLEQLEQRLGSLERIPENRSLADLTQQVSLLERRTDQLQGDAETLRYDATETAERQRLLYADLDARIQSLESALQARAGNVLDGGTLPPGQLPIPEGSARDNYQVALELLREERYDMAASSFNQFLVAFPESELADNAQYWLAESYYAADKFEQALNDFETVIEAYPESRKVPDALLKMGYCNYSLKRWDAARMSLTRVQSEYPETTAARLAEQYLKRMAAEGV
jgi:tol-pal system protein YbgF